MRAKSVSHKSNAAVVLIDVINHFEFPDGEKLLKQALPVAPRLAALKKRARRVLPSTRSGRALVRRDAKATSGKPRAKAMPTNY